MVEVQRIWRIPTSPQSAIQLRLSSPPDGQQRVVLEEVGPNQPDGKSGRAFDVDVARVLAQVMLEACEVASALA